MELALPRLAADGRLIAALTVGLRRSQRFVRALCESPRCLPVSRKMVDISGSHSQRRLGIRASFLARRLAAVATLAFVLAALGVVLSRTLRGALRFSTLTEGGCESKNAWMGANLDAPSNINPVSPGSKQSVKVLALGIVCFVLERATGPSGRRLCEYRYVG